MAAFQDEPILWMDSPAYSSSGCEDEAEDEQQHALQDPLAQLLQMQERLAAYEAENAQLRSKVEAQNKLLLQLQAVALQEVQPPHHPSTVPNALQPHNFVLSKLKLVPTSGHASYDGHALLVQTPVMMAPFGVSRWEAKYDVQLSFEGMECDPALRAMYDMLQAMDAHVAGLLHQKQHTPSIRPRRDARYAPTFKVSLPQASSSGGASNTAPRFAFKTCVCDDQGRELQQVEDLAALNTRGARMQAVVQLASVWVMGNKCGLTWRMHRLHIFDCNVAALPCPQASVSPPATTATSPTCTAYAADSKDDEGCMRVALLKGYAFQDNAC